MSLFKVKEGDDIFIVYRNRGDHPETYATYHVKPEQDAEKEARRKAYQLNKKVRTSEN